MCRRLCIWSSRGTEHQWDSVTRMQRLAFADAMSYWISAAIPNDQFLVYCFAETGLSMTALADQLYARASRIPDLNLCIMDLPGTVDRPYWIAATADRTQIRVHEQVRTWPECLARLGELIADQVTATDAPWRLHLFGPLVGVPRSDSAGVVVVLQIAHALGDGRVTSQIARQLLASPADHDARMSQTVGSSGGEVRRIGASVLGLARIPMQVTEMFWRGMHAYRLASDEPSVIGGGGFVPTALNRPSGADRSMRVIVVDREKLTGPRDSIGAAPLSVTVAALTAISVALPAYLGESEGALGVELTVGGSGDAHARNNFRNVGIDLRVDVGDVAERSRLIADAVAAARRASMTPARAAARRASESTPAALTHWGVRQFDITRPPASVTGVTVVSSVDRGPDDLILGHGRVLFSTGFPALSPAQGLTHGVHGLGDAVAISVTTSPEVMPDVDRYVGLLTAAIGAVGRGAVRDHR